MEVQQVDVWISPDGEVRLEVRGAAGPSCLDLTAGLEAALGGEVISRELTAEAAAVADASETEPQHLGWGS